MDRLKLINIFDKLDIHIEDLNRVVDEIELFVLREENTNLKNLLEKQNVYYVESEEKTSEDNSYKAMYENYKKMYEETLEELDDLRADCKNLNMCLDQSEEKEREHENQIKTLKNGLQNVGELLSEANKKLEYQREENHSLRAFIKSLKDGAKLYLKPLAWKIGNVGYTKEPPYVFIEPEPLYHSNLFPELPIVGYLSNDGKTLILKNDVMFNSEFVSNHIPLVSLSYTGE